MERLYKTGDVVVFKKTGFYGFHHTNGDFSVIAEDQMSPGASLLLGNLGLHGGMRIRPSIIRKAVGKDLKRLRIHIEESKKKRIAQELEQKKMRVIRD